MMLEARTSAFEDTFAFVQRRLCLLALKIKKDVLLEKEIEDRIKEMNIDLLEEEGAGRSSPEAERRSPAQFLRELEAKFATSTTSEDEEERYAAGGRRGALVGLVIDVIQAIQKLKEKGDVQRKLKKEGIELMGKLRRDWIEMVKKADYAQQIRDARNREKKKWGKVP
jgi:hypothetical protein